MIMKFCSCFCVVGCLLQERWQFFDWMLGTLSTNLERTPYPLAVGRNYRLLAQQTDIPKIPGRGKRVREFE